ncbi:MAG TPA: DinB family protein [Acidimicrobiia bacterium]|nr:DinB family protein [Acidimicrobiia bacterium]
MLTNTDLVRDFERNRRIVQAQCDGLDHADSLVQPPFAANCLNWTIGHLVMHRHKVLDLVGADHDIPAFERYDRESDPVTGDGPGVRPLADLLAALDDSQIRLSAALEGADLAADRDDERFPTVGHRARFYYFHDTYHTGQVELLRALAGRTDKVI